MMTEQERRRASWHDGFNRAIGRTTIAEAIARDLASNLFDEGFSKRAQQILRSTLLFRHEWGWPELDEWAGRFSASRRWPEIWKNYADAYRAADDNEKRSERIALLHHYLLFAASNAQLLADFLAGQQSGWSQRRLELRCTEDRSGAIEKSIAKTFQKLIAAGDYSQLPPFFPGDRTSLVSIRIGGPHERPSQ